MLVLKMAAVVGRYADARSVALSGDGFNKTGVEAVKQRQEIVLFFMFLI